MDGLMCYLCDELDKTPFAITRGIHIYIVSDFNDDKFTYETKKYLENMKRLNLESHVKKISLIEFPTKWSSRKDLYLRGIESKKKFVQTANSVFFDHCIFDTISLTKTLEDIKNIYMNFNNIYIDNNYYDTSIDFYKPFNEGLSTVASSATLIFNNNFANASMKFTCNDKKNDDIINLKCVNIVKNNDNNYKLLLANDNELCNIDESVNKLKCTIVSNCELENKTLYLDLMDNINHKRNRLRINILQLLSFGMCIYISILYSIIVLCFSLNIFISSFIHMFIPNGPDGNKKKYYEVYGKFRGIYIACIIIILLFNVWYISSLLMHSCWTQLLFYILIFVILIYRVFIPFIESYNNHLPKWRARFIPNDTTFVTVTDNYSVTYTITNNSNSDISNNIQPDGK